MLQKPLVQLDPVEAYLHKIFNAIFSPLRVKLFQYPELLDITTDVTQKLGNNN